MDDPQTEDPPVNGGEPRQPAGDEGAKLPEPVLGESGEKALKAEREARKRAERELKEASDRLKAIEDEQKSEAERLAERAQAAEDALSATNDRLARIEACVQAGLDPQYAGRLQGSNLDELAADAVSFAQVVRGSGLAPAGFDGGIGKPPPAPSLDDDIAAAEQAGDFKRAIALKTQKLAATGGQASA